MDKIEKQLRDKKKRRAHEKEVKMWKKKMRREGKLPGNSRGKRKQDR